MSSGKSAIAYEGFWINWAYGRVVGSTLTLSAENSAFLIAFIALFVRFVGSQLWGIVTYLISVHRSTAEPQDALYHQQQAILRNTSQPASVIWSMLKLWWFWRGNAEKAHTRTLMFVVNGLAFAAAFAVAGIFSSKITSTNSEVLLLPHQHCGSWYYPYIQYMNNWDSSKDYYSEWWDYAINYNQLARKSHVYVAECYNSTLNNLNEFCLPYGKSRISWDTNFDVECPFDDMCIASAVQFDTGYLNSDDHLGINTRKDHVEYRRVMTCAPITTNGYVSSAVNISSLNYTDNSLNGYEDMRFITYSYGENAILGDNITYAFSNYSWIYSAGYNIPFRVYDLDVEFSAAVPDDPEMLSQPTFSAIPALSRPDADTTLIFLSSGAIYMDEVNDPWFLANNFTDTYGVSVNGSDFVYKQYVPNAPVTVMACTEQHQIRDPINGAVSPLGGQEVLTHASAVRLGFNDNQLAVFNRSFALGAFSSLAYVVPALSGSSLLAAAYTVNEVSTGMPDNQWQFECEHWFGVVLNTIQLWSEQYISGPLQPEHFRYVHSATDGFAKEMCANQIAVRTDYRSFNVLGMLIIFIFGLLTIITFFVIGPIVETMQKRTVQGRYRNAEWQANDFLQLQRMAYQHSNTGTWTGQDQLVPRTNPGEVFTLPESTQWNRTPPELPSREKRGLLRSWYGGSSQDVSDLKPLIADTKSIVEDSSDSAMNEKSATATAHVEEVVEDLNFKIRTEM